MSILTSATPGIGRPGLISPGLLIRVSVPATASPVTLTASSVPLATLTASDIRTGGPA